MPTLSRGDFTTYYEDTGQGEPLVLVCGLSSDLQAWRFQVPELSGRFRVICVDNRGAGRTSAPDTPYSVQGMAEDLVALLDHLELAEANVLGWSMGGVIAQTLALSNPSKVKRLALLGTFAEADGLLRLAVKNWLNVRRSNMPYDQVVRHLARWIYSPSLANNDAAFESFVQAMIKNPYRQTLHGFVRQAEALLAYSAPSQLASIRAPSLVLVGEHDQLTPLYMSEQLALALPESTLQILPGGHAGFVEYPKQYNQAILRFLEGVKVAPAV